MSDKNKCPVCGLGMLLFSSLRMKICVKCNKVYTWDLTEGQQPLVKHQR